MGAGEYFLHLQVVSWLAQRSCTNARLAQRSCTNARSRRSRVPGAAQHEAQRNDALQTRDRYGLRRSRISDAPLRCARAASRPGHVIASDAFVALFTFQTAHLIPAARFCARG